MGQRTDQGRRAPDENPGLVTAVIFDTPSLFARGWFASRQGELAEDHDSPVAAATACFHSLFSVLDKRNIGATPTQLLFCWDGKSKTEKPRTEKTEEYKEDMAFLKTSMTALLGGVHATSTLESDDAVATVAYRLADRGSQCVVVSGDKDLHQIVGQNIGYYCLNKKCLLSRKHILERWGCSRPIQVGVILALLGDPQDGICGVNRWGKKTVTRAFKSVTEDMELPEVIDHIVAMIPATETNNFYTSLDATLLRPDIPRIPDPAPLTFCSLDSLYELRLGHLRAEYARFMAKFGHVEDVTSEVDEHEV